jgi:prepilin peptidase CpaA
MLAPVPFAFGVALAIAAAAAVSDLLSGTIPNWLTLPPIILAPPAYAFVFGLEYGLQCVAAVLVSGVAPYLLFRQQAMGGGDVKLFTALGAATGFDPFVGIQIQLGAFAVALLIALSILAWKGRLLITLACAAGMSLNRVLPRRHQLRACEELMIPVRMGGAVFAATTVCALPHLMPAWSGL